MVLVRQLDRHVAARTFVTAVFTWLAVALPLFSCQAAAAPNKIVISYAILSEREGSENSYFWLLNEETQAAAFQAHAYAHPIIGWRGDLLTMQRDDLF